MNIRNFIGASSAVLLSWLGITFFYQVPSELYPAQNRTSTSSTPPKNSDSPSEAIVKNDSLPNY